jgi:hypothetical protein
MTSRLREHALVPDGAEWRAARTWLLPWAVAPGWWRPPMMLTIVLGVVRAVLLLMSHRAWFMNDSTEYLALVDDLYVPRTRPPGIAVFWSGALLPWHSLLSILAAQSLLGVLGGVVIYFVARELGLRNRVAFVVATLASCTPTILFFERVLLSEALATFLLVCALWGLLIAVRTRSAMAWAVTGLIAATTILVRTVASISLVVFGLVAILATRGSLFRRLASVAAFAVASAVVLGGYAFAVYVDSRAITGEGRFGLQFTDGFAYFVATAPLTDCSPPDRPPPIRAAVCAIPGYLERDPDVISWGPGPVNEALRSRGWIERNDELRRLALENVRRDPLGALGLAGGRAVRLFSTYDNQYFTDGRPVSPQLEALDLPVPQPARGIDRMWPHAVDAWVVARALLWIALLAALAVAPRRWSRGGRELVIVSAPAIATIVWLCLAVTVVARYLLPFEAIGWLAAGWLFQTVLDDRRVLATVELWREVRDQEMVTS